MYQCRCTAKNSWWRAERLSETCRVVIPIKLEFSASIGFIHKEFVTMHGNTILKKSNACCGFVFWGIISLIRCTHRKYFCLYSEILLNRFFFFILLLMSSFRYFCTSLQLLSLSVPPPLKIFIFVPSIFLSSRDATTLLHSYRRGGVEISILHHLFWFLGVLLLQLSPF